MYVPVDVIEALFMIDIIVQTPMRNLLERTNEHTMKNILCPVDLTAGSYHTSKYAALLAREMNCRLVLAVMSNKNMEVPAGTGPPEWGGPQQQLSEMRDLVNTAYRVHCATLSEQITPGHLEEFTSPTRQYSLAVVGLPPVGSAKAKLYADILIKLVQTTRIPLLLIPENTGYRKIERLLYAFDYHHANEAPLLQLGEMSGIFNASVRFLSILPSDISSREEQEINSIHNRILNEWTYAADISFETIPYDNVPLCLSHYLAIWKASDLLVLTVNQQNRWSKIWHKSVVKELLKSADHPYLILRK
jgi:hypothetical protein